MLNEGSSSILSHYGAEKKIGIYASETDKK